MGILENFANDQPINIEETFPVEKKATAYPKATARNEAALAALLEPEGNITDTYKLLYSDNLQGGSEFTNRKRERILAGYKESDSRIAMDMLSDPSLSDEKKQSALEVMQKEQPSLAEIYKVKIAAKGVPSKNAETQKVVDTAHNYLDDELAYAGKSQAIINSAMARMDGSFSSLTDDAIEYLVPGGMTAQAVGTLSKAQKALGLTPEGTNKYIQSEAKVKLIKHLDSLPANERIKAIQTLTDSITNSSGIILKDKNDLEALNLLQQVGNQGEYGTGSRIADAIFQVLDAIPFAGAAFKGIQKVKGLLKPSVALNAPAPLTPIRLATSSNPAAAKEMYQEVVKQSGDDLAEAVAGTSRTDTILHTEGVQHLEPTTVEAKIIAPSGNAARNEELQRAIKQGGYQWEPGEVSLAIKETQDAVRNAVGPTQFDNFTQIGRDGDKISVRTFYGNEEGGFLKAEEALQSAKFKFKEFEIAEGDMNVYSRTSKGEYEKVDLNSVKGVEGDYIVGLDFRQSIRPSELNPIDVKRNWADSIPFLRSQYWGSVSRNFFDASSMLPKHITGGMENAVDYSTHLDKHLITIVDDYAKQVKALPKGEQSSVAQVIKDSNFNRIEYADVTLKGRYGLSDEGVAAVKKWREGWDVNHYLTNLTNVKSLNNSGYKILEHNNAKLFGKEIPKNGQLGKVYDPDLDVVRQFTQKEVDDLYNNGGSFAKLKSPETIKGENVTHFAVTNQPSNYLRAVAHTDNVVNYIPGYYKIYYNSPRFVVQHMKDVNGQAYEKAIAVAGDWKEAEAFLNKMASQAGVLPEEFGRVRGDVKKIIPGSDEEWQLSSSAGKINQRHRGQLLQDSGSPVHLGQSDFIVDPLDSFVRASSNAASKVAMQDNIDLAKQRLMEQFKNVMPVDGSYPNSWQAIGKKGDMYSKESRDARTLWDYIDQQENSILNGVDELTKHAASALADALGKAGYAKSERVAAGASRLGITSGANNFIHQALIKYNPLRNWVVQPLQSLQMYAYDPIAAFMTRKNQLDLLKIEAKMLTNTPLSTKDKELYSFVKEWGGFAGVDRQVMTDGPLRDLVKNSNSINKGIGNVSPALGKVVGEAARAVGKVSDFSGKIGFDAAEKYNLLNHILTVRNKYIRMGEDVTKPEVIDAIRAETRSLTLSLNSAGDMPYNKSAAALFVKFLQIPHKGLLKVTTNRRLEGAAQLRIAAFDALLYGVPMAAVGEWMGKDVLSDNPKIREAQQFGFLTAAYNELWRSTYGVDPQINLQNLGPYELDGWRKLFSTLMEDGFYKTMASGPAGTMLLGSNPRVANAFEKMGSWMGVNRYKDNPATFMETLTEFAKIASGVNNAVNYAIIVNTNNELNKLGVKVREGVDNWVALHELFGMPTTPEDAKFKTMDTIRKDTKSKQQQIEADVQYMMRLNKDRYEQSTDNPESIVRTIQMFNKAYEHDPRGLEMANKAFIKYAQGQDAWFVNAMLNYAGIVEDDKMMSVLKRSGMKEEEIQNFMPVIKSLRDAHEMEKINEYERQANK